MRVDDGRHGGANSGNGATIAASAVAIQSETMDPPDSFEALLTAVLSAPLRDGARAITENFVDTLATLFPDMAIGACIVTTPQEEPIVVLRVPGAAREPERNPTRLFSNWRHECVIGLEGREGSTLHVASNGLPVDASSRQYGIAARAGECLASCLRISDDLAEGSAPDDEVQHLRSQLIQSEKLASFGQLVAGVVHELANPLTSIVAYADYLRKKAKTRKAPEDDIQRLERIGEAAERILGFSRDLISYARPATDSLGPVALHEVIDRAVVFCEHEFSRCEVSIARDYDANVTAVVGQVGPLTQVFVNLFTNAAQAMSDHGGRLTVTTSLGGDETIVTVSDTGVGIRPDALERVFDPFFTTKENQRGAGLGLTIVREIIRSHFGRLETASTPGEGTTFTLRLRPFASRRSP